MQFISQTTSDGVVESSFNVDGVPGVLWSPRPGGDPAPLVLMGHPGGMHKRAQGLVARAAHFVTTFGFHAAAIDAPGHGERERSTADAAWVAEMLRARESGRPLGAIVSEFNASLAERAVPEWRATLDALQTLPEIDADAPVGYTGMTLATEIGLRLAAADPRIGAAGAGRGLRIRSPAGGRSRPHCARAVPAALGRPRNRSRIGARALRCDRLGGEVVARLPWPAPACAVVRGRRLRAIHRPSSLVSVTRRRLTPEA